jgi:hypothetical protein
MPAHNLIASGTVQPARFVTLSGDNQVAQSVAGDFPFGISGPGQKFAPIDFGNGYTPPTEGADSGDPLIVYTLGEKCLVQLGAGGCSAGNALKPDGTGQAIAAGNTTNDAYGAIALEGGSAGDQIQAMVALGRGT